MFSFIGSAEPSPGCRTLLVSRPGGDHPVSPVWNQSGQPAGLPWHLLTVNKCHEPLYFLIWNLFKYFVWFFFFFFFFLASFKYQKNYYHSESWNEKQHILLNMLASNSTIWISKRKVKGSKMNTSLSAQALLN